MEINGKTFFISGGGSGLGAATARVIAQAGGKVLIADINEETGNSMVSELGADKARFVRADVSEEAQVQAAVDAAVAFGELRGAMNCAGIGTGEKTVSKNGPHRLTSYQKVIQVNLIGTFNVLRLAAVAMAQNEPTAAGERGV